MIYIFVPFQVTESVVTVVDNIIRSYVENDNDANNTVSEAPNQIQRALERQISTFQSTPGNRTMGRWKAARGVAIKATKVPKESVVNRPLAFQVIPEEKKNVTVLNTTLKTGEPTDKETGTIISLQLPADVLVDKGISKVFGVLVGSQIISKLFVLRFRVYLSLLLSQFLE